MKPKTRTVRSVRRGFTLVEALVVVIIIGALVSILLVALAGVMRGARASTERLEIASLKVAVEQFKTTFGFLPPLIDDAGGPITGGQLNVRPDRFLSGQMQVNEPRYSVYSLPYFVMGLGDAPGAGGRPIDGAPGPRLTKPNPDGTFSAGGTVYEPFSAIGSKDSTRIIRGDDARLVTVDRWGRAQTFGGTTPPMNSLRYYRWLPKMYDAAPGQLSTVEQYMVPRAVGDPNINEGLRKAGFAIVSVGPNGITDERRPLPRAETSDPGCDDEAIDVDSTKDDIVEVGG